MVLNSKGASANPGGPCRVDKSQAQEDAVARLEMCAMQRILDVENSWESNRANLILGGGFEYSPLFGEDSHFD